MNKKLNSVISVAAIIVIGVGLVSWQLGYKSGLNKSGLGVMMPGYLPQSYEMRGIAGTVEKIGDANITIKVSLQIPNSKRDLSVRVVSIDKDTVIERLTQKDIETIKKEQNVFTEKMNKILKNTGTSSPTNLPLPPDPFTREKILLKDIKVGDNVTVSADKNIATESRFTAKSISVMFSPNLVIPAQPK